MPLSTCIGPYRVLRLIKRGGQGRVYLGYDSRLRRSVAIKVHRLPEDRAGKKRLQREAQLVASIESAKVVQIYDLVFAQENVALIMEYVSGCDLEELLQQTRPSVASVLTVATDLAGALAAARQQQIVHGDLKARNVLVTDTGRVKLTDFGIAHADSELTPGLARMGSPSCISPEQYLGNPLDVRSDLFALGCLLYRMLTGSAPFVRDGRLDPASLLEKTPEPLETLVQDLPAGLSDLVFGLLQKKPADRPQDTQQVRFALRNIARAIPLSVSSALLEEARPHFREESEGDVPPLIPVDLQRSGRSRLQPFQLDQLSSWRNFFSRIGKLRLAASLVFIVLCCLFLLRALVPGETEIYIERPALLVAAGMELPPEVSSVWLVDQIKAVARLKLGAVHVSGPVGATPDRTLHAVPPAERETQEQLSVALRCAAQLCLFTIDRRGSGTRQAVLFSDTPLEEWRSAIRSATAALFD